MTYNLRPEEWMLGGVDILAIAADVHAFATGSSDCYLSYGRDYAPRLLAILKARLAGWTPTRCAFDAAVRAMLEAAVAEAEAPDNAWLFGPQESAP